MEWVGDRQVTGGYQILIYYHEFNANNIIALTPFSFCSKMRQKS